MRDADTESEIIVGVTEAEIGRELLDISANFGFDIPDEALQHRDMQALIQTEEKLYNYQPGQPNELAEILAQFMQVKGTMQI